MSNFTDFFYWKTMCVLQCGESHKNLSMNKYIYIYIHVFPVEFHIIEVIVTKAVY